MQPGVYGAPRKRLNPKLRAAAVAAMRAGRPSGHVIALLAGFTHPAKFSGVLHSRRIAATPLTVGRLLRVAEVVGFTGELFLHEPDGDGYFSEVPVAPGQP